MRAPRGYQAVWKLASVALLAALLLASVPVTAAPQHASLLARAPLDADGPTSLDAARAGLVLRDPGKEGFAQVRFDITDAGVAKVTLHKFTETCLGASQIGSFPSLRDVVHPSPLADIASGADRVVAGVALPVRAPSLASTEQGAAQTAGDVAAMAASTQRDLVLAASSSPLVPPVPMGPTCTSQSATDQPEVLHLRVAKLELVPSDQAYVIAYDGLTGDQGSVHLRSATAGLDQTREDTVITPLSSDDPWQGTSVPTVTFPKDSLRTDVAGAQGTFGGNGKLLAYRTQVHLTGLDDKGNVVEKQYKTGETREPGALGPVDEKRTLVILEVDLTGTQGRFATPSTALVFAPDQQVQLDGRLHVPAAWGSLTIDGTTKQLEGDAAMLEGTLRLQMAANPRGDSDNDHAKRHTVTLSMDGETFASQSITEDAQQLPGGVSAGTAAVSGLAVGAALLAWFWPSVKFLLAPLYTRIPRDAVLMHGARERIYKLVKEEPGIHAHEVAQRLGLGWGTTVYHLKLLEKNQLLVSRHEGRYKRFFVTGDARIQHKDAIALLRNATSHAIAQAVAEKPGLIQKDVCAALQLSPSLASWHLQRMEAAGVVHAERWGRTVRYSPGPAWGELLNAGGMGIPLAAAPIAPASPAESGAPTA